METACLLQFYDVHKLNSEKNVSILEFKVLMVLNYGELRYTFTFTGERYNKQID